jgi:hypothetical protein
MTKQLVTLTPEIQAAFPVEVLDVIRTSLCPNATDPEFLLFAHKAAAYGLDPFKNEIFFIKYGQQARIQFAAEAYLSKAREKEGFQPPDTQMVCENDEFKVIRNKETKELEVITHEMGFPRGKIIGAYSIAYRNGFRPVTVVMDRAEIEHQFTGQNKDNWNKWTHDMFGKHVETRSLKKQYGLEFGDDDIPQAQPLDTVNPYERKDITPEVTKTPKEPTEIPQETEGIDPAVLQWNLVGEGLRSLGITEKDKQAAYIRDNLKIKGKAATVAELKGLIKIINLAIEEKNDGLGELE